MADAPRLQRLVRPWLALMAVAGVVAFIASGAHQSLSVEGVRDWVAAAGPWGPLLFVAIFAVTQPFGLSAHAFILASSLVWPPVIALPLSWVGALIATGVSYAFARYVGRDWVQARLPERLRTYDDRLSMRGFRTVVMLRLLFFTFAPLQLMFGVSQVKLRDVILGSAIGLLPVMTLEVFMGASAFEWITG